MRLGEIMTREVKTAAPSESAEEAYRSWRAMSRRPLPKRRSAGLRTCFADERSAASRDRRGEARRDRDGDRPARARRGGDQEGIDRCAVEAGAADGALGRAASISDVRSCDESRRGSGLGRLARRATSANVASTTFMQPADRRISRATHGQGQVRPFRGRTRSAVDARSGRARDARASGCWPAHGVRACSATTQSPRAARWHGSPLVETTRHHRGRTMFDGRRPLRARAESQRRVYRAGSGP